MKTLGDPNIHLTFEQHGKVLKALREGRRAGCPKCLSEFKRMAMAGVAICQGCGAIVRELER